MHNTLDPPSSKSSQGIEPTPQYTKPYTVYLHKALTQCLHLNIQAVTHSFTNPTSHALSRSQVTSN
jgi:hypothetical protein